MSFGTFRMLTHALWVEKMSEYDLTNTYKGKCRIVTNVDIVI